MSDTTTTESAAPVDDLRSDIAAAFDAPEAPITETAAPETAAEQSARERDERGRFASTKAEAAPETEAPAEEPKSTDQPETKADEAQTAPIAPPQSWTAAERAHWDALPRDAQAAILRRESDYSKGIQQKGEALKTWEPIEQQLESIKPKLAMQGVTPTQFIGNLLNAHHALESRPVEAFLQLAKHYGVDLNSLTSSQQTQQQAAPDPYGQRIAQLEQQLSTREEGTILQQIETFAADPANAYFQDVRREMGAMMQAGLVKDGDFKGAYDRACWANPEIRARIQDDQRRQEAAERDKLARAARGKSVSVSGSPPVSGNGAQPDSIRGTLEAAWGGAR